MSNELEADKCDLETADTNKTGAMHACFALSKSQNLLPRQIRIDGNRLHLYKRKNKQLRLSKVIDLLTTKAMFNSTTLTEVDQTSN